MSFGNLTLASEERRVNVSTKITASPEVVDLIDKAWAAQQEQGETSLGHSVGVGDAELVEQFHAEARAACNAHEPRLKYRKLARLGKSKSPENAYFSVSLWPVGETENAEPETENAEPEKSSTRRRTAK